ncbi:MAG TPA: Clp protease N-terminal domain-containing protein [Actinomycetota bacterium]|nr:Clp protease N-terminal domain-containing protein [Actinomycetota bacterium]
MFGRLSEPARDLMGAAYREAVALGHNYVGTEHLLLAVATQPGTAAARALAGLGVTADDLRAETTRIVGVCEWAPAIRPDPEALSRIGIDLDEVRRRVEDAFGPGALESTCAWGRGLGLTPKAKKTYWLALREAVRLGDRAVRPEHVLLALASRRDALSARLLRRKGVSPERLRLAVLHELGRLAG